MKPKIKIRTRNLIAALTAFSASAALAADYTSRRNADGITMTLDSGDTVTATSENGTALRAANDGILQINPINGSITVTSNGYTVLATTGGSINLGSGSVVTSNFQGLHADNLAAIAADHVTVTVGSLDTPISSNNARGVEASSTGQINLGAGSTVTVYAGTSTMAGISNAGGTLTATDGLSIEVIGGGFLNSHYAPAIRTVGGGITDVGTNARITALQGRGIGSGNVGSTVIIGAGAEVEAIQALHVTNGGQLTATEGTFRGVGVDGTGAVISDGSISNITNSALSGEKNALFLGSATSITSVGPASITISGGTLTSGTGALIASGTSNQGNSEPTDTTVTIKDGAQATSGNGVLYDASAVATNIGSAVSIIVEGAATTVDGTFLGNANIATSLSVSDGATWASAGASVMDNLTLADATVTLSLTALGDGIQAGQLLFGGTGKSDVSFTVEDSVVFSTEVLNAGEYVWDILTGASGDYTANVNWNPTNTSNAYATWEWENIGDGQWRMYNIVVSNVPEPATYAALAALAILAWAALRRRGSQ
ncbi:PEP-CTERM putative exosortase interaction domain-containing protein [Opitutaceae bacterium TAV1]|nr:PEP-CTERM putative exosortase interaction domain-containing protein [Opitutaceae bacterium TAV1]